MRRKHDDVMMFLNLSVAVTCLAFCWVLIIVTLKAWLRLKASKARVQRPSAIAWFKIFIKTSLLSQSLHWILTFSFMTWRSIACSALSSGCFGCLLFCFNLLFSLHYHFSLSIICLHPVVVSLIVPLFSLYQYYTSILPLEVNSCFLWTTEWHYMLNKLGNVFKNVSAYDQGSFSNM